MNYINNMQNSRRQGGHSAYFYERKSDSERTSVNLVWLDGYIGSFTHTKTGSDQGTVQQPFGDGDLSRLYAVYFFMCNCSDRSIQRESLRIGIRTRICLRVCE